MCSFIGLDANRYQETPSCAIPVWWERLPLRAAPVIIRGTGPNKDPDRPPHLMTSRETAMELGITLSAVQRAARTGKLKVTRGTGHPYAFRFERGDVKDYLDSLAVQGQRSGHPVSTRARKRPTTIAELGGLSTGDG